MMGQLGDLKQVVGGPAHQLAGAVLVVKGEGQVLHMAEHIPADVRLDAHAHHVPVVAHDIVHARPQHIGGEQDGHDREKGLVQGLGQQLVHGIPGKIGERQVHQGDAQRTGHVQQKQAQMGPVVGQENGQIPLLKSLFAHNRLLFYLILSYHNIQEILVNG